MKALYFLLLFTYSLSAQDFEQVRDSLKTKYKHINNFKNGYASVTNKVNKAGIIDSLGNEALPLLYDWAKFSNGVFVVQKKKHYGLYSVKNKEIVPVEYDWLLPRSYNLFLAQRKKKHGIINSSGSVILPLIYNSTTIYNDTFIIARLASGNYNIFDLSGKQLQPFDYKIFALYKDVAFCSDGKKCYLINLNNLESPKLLDIDSFAEYGFFDYEQHGYHVFKKDNKFGVMSYKGEILIPPQYDELLHIHSITEEFVAKKDGKYGILNVNNIILQPFNFKEYQIRKEYIILTDVTGKTSNHNISFRREDLP
ncbi:hypothetical protein AM493_18035 [Flavobacterium akiainvivens]|uniref:WG repeat-containing protein n=1 Tax=Flavobacterium akiainvivens TaxID=1202724 RepID=A0A0M8MFC4_9FLAO|nr:WG repeat-containing protein [Flavobacterium akiainvivens]KOS07734.1 hypothetical protein AM493_18035 [Flavobacterium akiainvivens]SFQ25249.1 WG containing repeat-containing protein [Flavobacterium akiainvivens]